jgi:two-component system nitrate/nitrite response regulator NarL
MNILISSPFWHFREGLASFINNEVGFKVIGEISEESELYEVASNSKADAILLDIDQYNDLDFKKIKQISATFPSSSIIVLCSVESKEKVIASISNGAEGFLSKKMTKSHLVASLKALQKGEAILPRKLVSTVIAELKNNSKDEDPKDMILSKLTYREFEVLSCLKKHESNREIAKKLVISENTVRVHVHNILKKLKVENRQEAAYLADQVDQLD